MNKKEQAEFDAAKKAVVVARALNWTEPVAPDVPPPSWGEPLTTGYVLNTYNACVNVACSSSVSHSIGKTDRVTSQNSRSLYSTKLLALRALRHAVEKECAEKLASIDLQIQAEQQP